MHMSAEITMWILTIGLLVFALVVLASGALIHGAAMNGRGRARLDLHAADGRAAMRGAR